MQKCIKSKSASSKFLSNSGWMMGQQIYGMLTSLVVGSLSARYLGPSNYGIINYGASIISFFMIISRLGLDGVIINEMIKNPARQGGFLGSALLMRLITSIFSLFMIVTLVRVLEPENNSLSLVTFLQAFAVILQGYEVLTYWFQLQLKIKYVAIATMIGLTVSAVWRILLLSTGASLYFFALSYSIQYAVCFLLIFILFTKDTKGVICLSWNKKDAWHLLKNSYHFIISGIAVTLYMQIDKIMIGKILNSTEVGIYTAASTVAALWEFVPNALINSARPLILEERMKNYDNYIKKYQQLLLGITIMFVVVSCSLVFCGKWVVLVLYGNNYMEAVIPLGILVWSTGFSMIGSARGIWTIGEGLNRYMKYIVFIGAGINLVLNFFFIRLWGIIGASITTLISQISVALIIPLMFDEVRPVVSIYFGSFKQIPALLKICENVFKNKL